MMSIMVCAGCLISAIREKLRTKVELSCLMQGLEKRSSEGPTWASVECGSIQSAEIESLLDDACLGEQLVLDSNSRALNVLALSELGIMARFSQSRTGLFARSLPKICFLAAGAAAITILALGAMSADSLILAGSSVVACLVGASACRVFTTQARKSAIRFAEVVSSLASAAEARWMSEAEEARSC